MLQKNDQHWTAVPDVAWPAGLFGNLDGELVGHDEQLVQEVNKRVPYELVHTRPVKQTSRQIETVRQFKSSGKVIVKLSIIQCSQTLQQPVWTLTKILFNSSRFISNLVVKYINK